MQAFLEKIPGGASAKRDQHVAPLGLPKQALVTVGRPRQRICPANFVIGCNRSRGHLHSRGVPRVFHSCSTIRSAIACFTMSGGAEDGGEAVTAEAMQAAQATMPVAASAAAVGMSGPQSSQAALSGVLRNSAFMPVPPAAAGTFMPELQLFSQFPQLFSMHPASLAAAMAAQPEATASGRTRTGDSKSTSAYASRHQAAEQRRRTRINERCVPREGYRHPSLVLVQARARVGTHVTPIARSCMLPLGCSLTCRPFWRVRLGLQTGVGGRWGHRE